MLLPVSLAQTHMDSTSTDTTLLAQIALLEQQLQQAQEEIAQLQNEKADLEMMLEMTTEHSDSLEEELYEKVEATLRDSEKRFRTIAETIPVPVIISHAENQTILYANAPVGRLVGMQTDEVIGCKLRNFSRNRNDLQKIYAILEAEGQVSNYEMLGKTKDGQDFWVEVNVHAITFNDEPCILIAMYDITDRKRAEQERVQLTANLEQALDQQRTLTKAYSRFVPVEILKFLGKESIVDVQLGEHTRQEMTVLFSDIRSFTTLSEHMTPQENFNFINSYLSRVSPVIRKNNGFIDKYIGDAIMALFPGSKFPGQADDALQAAVEMQQEVTLYNIHRAKQGYQPIHIGVGLHTGSVMLGTVGEAERMEGTVISDAVNLASRLEGLTKLYNVSIVVSERTLFSLERVMKYRFRFLDKVLVKGKKEPVSVFEILEGLAPEVIERRLRTQTYFEKGLLHYHSKEFLAAKEQFQQVLDIDPSDNAAELYIQRVNYYIEYGVPVNWEGVEALTEK